jgi:hypothetical protein
MLGERHSWTTPGIFPQHPPLCRTLEPAQGEVQGCRLSAVDRAFPLSPIIPACPERLLRRVHMRPSLSLIIPVHPRNAPVSPIIPAHTQKQGGGGVFGKMCSPITLLFSAALLTTQLSAIVGAPTFSSCTSSVGHKSDPPQKVGPYTRRRTARTDPALRDRPLQSKRNPKTQEHRPFDAQGKQECLCHRRNPRPR